MYSVIKNAIVLTAFLLLVSVSVLADETDKTADSTQLPVPESEVDYAAGGWDIYLGFFMPYATLGGDFDGQGEIVTGEFTSILPDIDGKVGTGITLGIRQHGEKDFASSVELSYYRASHDNSWSSETRKADMSTFGGDVHFMHTRYIIQPFAFLGGYLVKFDVEEGARDSQDNVYEAEYSGVATNVGLGFNIAVSRSIWLSSKIAYRRYWFLGYDAGEENISFDETLKSDGVWLSFGLYYGLRIK